MTPNNDHSPMVSVIIPIYNTEKYLEECISSVISQTYRDLEIILINDGSTDTSGEICDRFAAADERVKVIHKTNQGRSKARNDGLKLIKGDYFAFVDADDVLVSDAIELMVNETKEAPDIVFARMMQFFPDKEVPFREESLEAKSIPYDGLLEQYFLDNMHGTAGDYEIYNGPVARLYSNRLKGIHFAEDLSYAEDFLYSVMIILKCRRFRYLDKVVYRYRRFYDEENNFWEKFRNLSVEAADARVRSLSYVKDNEREIYQDYLLRSYYAMLDMYCNCLNHGHEESAVKIAEELDRIKGELRVSPSYKRLGWISKTKLVISFISYRLYSVLYNAHSRDK